MRQSSRIAPLLAGGLIAACLAGAVRADEITTAEGESSEGRLLGLQDGTVRFERSGGSEEARFPVDELRRIVLEPPAATEFGSRLVVDNDGTHEQRERSGKIKLKPGHHEFHLIYWQAGDPVSLSLEYEGPGISRAPVPPNLVFYLPEGQPEQEDSSGFDEQDLRLPEKLQTPQHGLSFRLYEWGSDESVGSIGDLRKLPVKTTGRHFFSQNGQLFSQNGQLPPHASKSFAVVLSGYLQVATEGEYTFHLKSAGGSRLYFGNVPLPRAAPPQAGEWTIRFEGEGKLRGKMASWNVEGLTAEVSAGTALHQVTVPRDRLREVWSHAVASGGTQVERSGEPDDADSAYAKTSQGQVQRVSGRAAGLSDAGLRFVYQERERSINLDRVLGIVLQAGDERDKRLDDFYQRITLAGGHQLPGHAEMIDDQHVRFTTLSGQTVEFERPQVVSIETVNGRFVPLWELTPARVEQVPFFDRVIPWQVNRSLSGEPLRIGETLYPHGLCLHSRTVLEYELSGRFSRFRSDLGLQNPEGELGAAAVRVVTDGDVLYEAARVTADSETAQLDLDVSGRERLVLEVDFGENHDIGDHVVWGRAHLLRPTRDAPETP